MFSLSPSRYSGLSLMVALFGVTGCASSAGSVAVAQDEAPIINGDNGGAAIPSTEHPEVGTLVHKKQGGGTLTCTATLIGPRAILTASHCHENTNGLGEEDTFQSHAGGRSYAVLAHKTLATGFIATDLEIGLLEVAAANSGITPAAMAARSVRTGDSLVAYGAGCTSRPPNEAYDGLMRKRSFGWTGTNQYENPTSGFLCPGDSGGPVYDRNGAIVLINEGYRLNAGNDLFAVIGGNNSVKIGEWATWLASRVIPSVSTDCSNACFTTGSQEARRRATDENGFHLYQSNVCGFSGSYHAGSEQQSSGGGPASCWRCAQPDPTLGASAQHTGADPNKGWYRAPADQCAGILQFNY